MHRCVGAITLPAVRAVGMYQCAYAGGNISRGSGRHPLRHSQLSSTECSDWTALARLRTPKRATARSTERLDSAESTRIVQPRDAPLHFCRLHCKNLKQRSTAQAAGIGGAYIRSHRHTNARRVGSPCNALWAMAARVKKAGSPSLHMHERRVDPLSTPMRRPVLSGHLSHSVVFDASCTYAAVDASQHFAAPSHNKKAHSLS